ncbi:MAG: cytochrome ubiquinol oxidase subunit [Hyphomicrobiales bacterium]|nr:cytochrome ubiquinol oxidase subunit [Hyphomicrobiales bacterium]
MSDTPRPEGSLDPQAWETFRASAHSALDTMIDHLAGLRDKPVWQAPPAETRARFQSPLPQAGESFDDVLDTFRADILPYGSGNTHPMFMGWVQGAGTPVGMVADMLAAGINANCGGRDHIALDVERQIVLWMAELFGFPKDSTGLFLTGSSQANFCALIVARRHALGATTRRDGLVNAPQLVAYTSSEAHSCIVQAMELSGIGSAHLRLVPVDSGRAMRVGVLAEMIARDRVAGLTPFLVVGTAGTVNTGAIDDLSGIADLCAAQKLWFHVDGALGALAALSPEVAPSLRGLERADSIAFDFHKWTHVPYDAGFLLVRDPQAHKAAFANPAAYLQREPEGLAAGETWPVDLGPDLSRSFRALKAWFTFKVHGAAGLGGVIAQTCGLAQQLATQIEASDDFVLAAPVRLNIVCFRPAGRNADLVRDIVMDLHTSGTAAPSMTQLDGAPVIRAAILNHRTTADDIQTFLTEVRASMGRVEMRHRVEP